jgi:hypothetical protein
MCRTLEYARIATGILELQKISLRFTQTVASQSPRLPRHQALHVSQYQKFQPQQHNRHRNSGIQTLIVSLVTRAAPAPATPAPAALHYGSTGALASLAYSAVVLLVLLVLVPAVQHSACTSSSSTGSSKVECLRVSCQQLCTFEEAGRSFHSDSALEQDYSLNLKPQQRPSHRNHNGFQQFLKILDLLLFILGLFFGSVFRFSCTQPGAGLTKFEISQSFRIPLRSASSLRS